MAALQGCLQFGDQHEMDDYRRLIFEHNLTAIKAHNTDHTQTYKMGVNHFTITLKRSSLIYLWRQLISHLNKPEQLLTWRESINKCTPMLIGQLKGKLQVSEIKDHGIQVGHFQLLEL